MLENTNMNPLCKATLAIPFLSMGLMNCRTVQRDEGAETAPEGLSALDKHALPDAHSRVDFGRHIKPVLESKCVVCHSGRGAAGGLRLESRSLAFSGNESAHRIVAGKPGESRLLDLAATHLHVATMPPVGNRLTKLESAILWRWISEGAEWPEGAAGHLRVSTAALHEE